MKVFRFSILCVGILVLLDGLSLASTYYVATNGDDSRSCSTAQNIATPKRTIPSAFGCLAPGDTLYTRSGSYPTIDSHSTVIPTGSSWSNAPLIAAYPGEAVTLIGGANIVAPSAQGQSEIKYVILDGFKFEASSGNALSIGGNVHHIRIINGDVYGARGSYSGINLQPKNSVIPSYVEIIKTKIHDNGQGGSGSGTTGHGIYCACTNSIFDGLDVYNNGDRGIQLFSMYISPDNNIVKNSKWHHNGRGTSITGSGVTIYGVNNLAFNNVIYDNPGNGFDVRGSGSHKVYNNTVAHNGGSAIEIQNATNNLITNNILWSNRSVITTYYGGNYSGQSNLTTVPSFVNEAGRDLRISATSAAKDAGVTISVVATDYNNVSRPQDSAYDIGAWEYVGIQTLAPPGNLIVQP